MNDTITITSYNVEKFIEKFQLEAIGWMYAYACHCLDNNIDLRQVEVPEIIKEYKIVFPSSEHFFIDNIT